MDISSLSRLDGRRTRSICAENPTGEKGRGGTATLENGIAARAARETPENTAPSEHAFGFCQAKNPSNGIRKVRTRLWAFFSATKLPFPRFRISRPSFASSVMTLLTVMRETLNSRHSSSSEGNLSPGDIAASRASIALRIFSFSVMASPVVLLILILV